MAPYPTRLALKRISERIDKLAAQLNASVCTVIIDTEVIEHFGARAHDVVLRRHYELHPEDRRARNVTFVVTGATRAPSDDTASGQLLKEIRALQPPLLMLPAPDMIQ